LTKRFDVMAAIAVGLLLPVLETIRRGFDHWSVNFTTMFEDYAGGAALLVAAVGVLRRAPWANLWMVISWSGITFMMLISTVSQVERNLTGDLEARSTLVLFIKVLLLVTSALALTQSARRTAPGSK
jgi:hypothetical protein